MPSLRLLALALCLVACVADDEFLELKGHKTTYVEVKAGSGATVTAGRSACSICLSSSS